MSTKKLDTDFIISDSSVNVYGMRLLTAGYDMEEFRKNPIGYYGHCKDDGVLLRWEDIHIDGDRVVARPVVNLEHPRAERTIKEVEEGFLNCASIGKLVILDAQLEDNPEDPNEPILVVTRWYNKECSLVDNPGNRHAMKIELYDGDDNEIQLSDMINSKINKPNMKRTVTLELSPRLMGLLNLGDDMATAEAVATGIEAMHHEHEAMRKAKEKAEQDLHDVQGKSMATRVKAILDKGLADRKFSAQTRDKLQKAYATMPDELEDLVKGMAAYESLVDRIHKVRTTSTGTDLEDKTWEELDRANQLDELKERNIDAFRKKYKERFGKEYDKEGKS